jgi:hypothetical protein
LKKISFVLAAVVLAAAPSAAFADAAIKGKILYAAGGAKLTVVLRTTADGSAQIIHEGRVLTIPASTIKVTGDRQETSLTKSELNTLK